MTLTPFSPETLDELALRLLDVAAIVRKMAHSARENSLHGFQLHGNKAQEWLDNLEQWAREAVGRQEAQVWRERGARRAQAPTPQASKAADRGRPRTRKKGK